MAGVEHSYNSTSTCTHMYYEQASKIHACPIINCVEHPCSTTGTHTTNNCRAPMSVSMHALSSVHAMAGVHTHTVGDELSCTQTTNKCMCTYMCMPWRACMHGAHFRIIGGKGLRTHTMNRCRAFRCVYMHALAIAHVMAITHTYPYSGR